MLRTRALLAVRVPAPLCSGDTQLRWLSEPPDVTRGDLVWYTDGSLVNGKWRDFASAGCALVAVNGDGALVAVAEARLPSKVKTAAEAEARALPVAAHCGAGRSCQGHRRFAPTCGRLGAHRRRGRWRYCGSRRVWGADLDAS